MLNNDRTRPIASRRKVDGQLGQNNGHFIVISTQVNSMPPCGWDRSFIFWRQMFFFQLKFRGVLAGAKCYYKCSCALRWRAGIGEGRMPSAHRPAKKAPMASSRRGWQRRRNHDAVHSPRFPFATRWLNIPSSLFFFVFPLVCFFFFLFAFPVKIGRKPQKHRPRINETWSAWAETRRLHSNEKNEGSLKYQNR